MPRVVLFDVLILLHFFADYSRFYGMFCAIKMPRNLYGAKFFQSIYFLRFYEERWLGSLKNRKMIADFRYLSGLSDY